MRGFSVYESANGKEALSVAESADIDLVIADIMMPVIDGNELVRSIRSGNAELPIIMLTALGTIEDKKKSYDCGADDYVTKPVNFDELELRMRALLRRYGRVSKQKLQVGNTELDYNTKTLRVNGFVKETAKKEFLLLLPCFRHRAGFIRALSYWTKCGGWTPKVLKEQWTYTSIR